MFNRKGNLRTHWQNMHGPDVNPQPVLVTSPVQLSPASQVHMLGDAAVSTLTASASSRSTDQYTQVS